MLKYSLALIFPFLLSLSANASARSELSDLYAPPSPLPRQIQELLKHEILANPQAALQEMIDRLLIGRRRQLPPEWDKYFNRQLELKRGWAREIHKSHVEAFGLARVGPFSWDIDDYRAVAADLPMPLLTDFLLRGHPLISYKVPLSLLKQEGFYLEGVDSNSIFVTQTSSETYVHLIEHPMGNSFSSELEELIAHWRTRGIEVQIEVGRYIGHISASRSMIVYPSTEPAKYVSVKTSMNRDLMNHEKNVTPEMLEAWMKLSDYFRRMGVESLSNEAIVLLDERGIGHKKVGQIERPLAKLKPEHFYLPGFTIFSNEGLRIAQSQGHGSDPLAYWEKVFFIPMAKAMAKIRGLTGAEHTSPHGQNILFELGPDHSPTGRIVIRDMDYYIDPAFVSELPDALAPKATMARLTAPGFAPVVFNFISPNQLPQWASTEAMVAVGKRYIETYASEYQKFTDVKISTDQLKVYDQAVSDYVLFGKATRPSPQFILNLEPTNPETYRHNARNRGAQRMDLDCMFQLMKNRR